jgi:hypothetical protein
VNAAMILLQARKLEAISEIMQSFQSNKIGDHTTNNYS